MAPSLAPQTVAQVQHAACLLNASRFAEACALLEAAAQTGPDHPDVLRLLAVALRGLGDLAAAEAALIKALALQPQNQDAATDLAALLALQSRFEDLLELTAEAAAIALPRAGLLGDRARALSALGRSAEALECARRTASLYPANHAVLHNLAATAADEGRDAEAVDAARRALTLPPASGPTWLVLARALHALGQTGEAEAAYVQAGHFPVVQIEAAAELSQLIWMRDGDLDRALAALESQLAAAAHTEARSILKTRLLVAGGSAAAGADLACVASDRHPQSVSLAITASQAMIEIEPQHALLLARRAMTAASGDPRTQRQLAEALIAVGDGAACLPLVAALRRSAPLDQGLIALELTALRLLGRPTPDALHDLDAVVRVSTIETPQEWPSLAAFLVELTIRLETFHADRRAHPVGQSLRQGTQTGVNLATLDDPVIAAFRQSIRKSVTRYIEQLGPGDDALRSRITPNWRLQSMWSVQLHAGGGHHTNHVHPNGWLSSACYIALPDDVYQSPSPADLLHDSAPGRLSLGQPAGPAGRSLRPDRFVQPEPGRLVLFPSYLWHGTTPFKGPGARLSIAFDIVPT